MNTRAALDADVRPGTYSVFDGVAAVWAALMSNVVVHYEHLASSIDLVVMYVQVQGETKDLFHDQLSFSA
jgi:hypothetical protein